jgi:hypothetical protein
VKPEPAAAGPVPIALQPDVVPDIVEAGDVEVSLPALPELPLNVKQSDCPEAPPTAAVEVPVDVNITGPPLQGISRWKHDGFALVGENKAPFTGFEKRVVRNYKKLNDTDFSFETVQPLVTAAGTRFISTSYEVKPNQPNRGVTPPAGPATPPNVGTPDRGLLLTKSEILDGGGQVVSSFVPTPALLLLPLPVTAGEQWQSVGVDPKTGSTVVMNATVSRRQRIDACGDLVDGWQVDATQLSSSAQNAEPSAEPTAYSYLVATQYGGMLIQERLRPPEQFDQTYDLSFTLGQLKPDPLPTP